MRRGVIFGGLAALGLVGALATQPGWGQKPGGPPPPPPPPSGSGPKTPPTGGGGGGGGTVNPPAPANGGAPLNGLTPAQLARWRAGQATFGQAVDVPGGLGPVFNDASCARCHAGGGGSPRLGTRFGRIVNGQFDPMVEFGGPLIQERGIGRFSGVNFVGETVPPQATIVAKRRTTSLLGLGLVDAVPDAVFLALAQHQQQTTPQTAGRVSVVTDPVTGQHAVGKFGWKAQQPNLFAFSADALVNELGVTTPVDPQENCPQGACNLLSANPARNTPNQTVTPVQQLTDFMAFLAPPPAGPTNADVPAGRTLFTSIGCADCHTPTFQTGVNAVAALNSVTFNPYSDFLLHDMGSLGDGIVQNTATGHEIRTAPLWGLRNSPTLLHDGRATNPTDAILAHDGQGAPARSHFNALTATQKRQLLAFLNSL